MKKLFVLALVAVGLLVAGCGNTAHVEVERVGDHELAICVYHTGINSENEGECQPNDVLTNAIVECSKEYGTQPETERELNGDHSGTILVKCASASPGSKGK